MGVEEEATGLSFGRGGRNTFERFAEHVDGSVGFGIRWIGSEFVGEKKETSSTAAGVRKNQVGGIGNDAENHVTGVITDGGIRMRGEVVEEHVAGFGSFLRRFGLTVGDLVEGNDDGLIDGATVI